MGISKMTKEGPWYVPGKWYVAPACFAEEVRATYDLPERVIVRDVTLSEGQHAIGVNYTLKAMLKIAHALGEAGVAEIKQHHGDFQTYEFIKAFKKEATEPKISLLIPVMPSHANVSKEQIDAYIDAGVDSIEVLGDMAARDRYIEVIKYVKGKGVPTEAGTPNAVRLPFEEVTEFYDAGIDAGASRVCVYDSFNPETPEAARYWVKEFKKAIRSRVPILWQSHNDYGLGTATTLGAITGGASACDLSVNGLGDRGGNASMEEVALVLESMYAVKTGIKLEKLCELSRLVIEASGVGIHAYKPIVGKNVFVHESEGHAVIMLRAGVDKDFIAEGEPYSPMVMGRKREVRMGGTSLGLIPLRLSQLGLKYTEREIKQIKNQLIKLWTEQKKDMSLEEFDALAKRAGKTK